MNSNELNTSGRFLSRCDVYEHWNNWISELESNFLIVKLKNVSFQFEDLKLYRHQSRTFPNVINSSFGIEECIFNPNLKTLIFTPHGAVCRMSALTDKLSHEALNNWRWKLLGLLTNCTFKDRKNFQMPNYEIPQLLPWWV